MRLYRFARDGQAHFGVSLSGNNRLLDLTTALPDLPTNPLEFLTAYSEFQGILEETVRTESKANRTFDLDTSRLLAPIPRPGKILCSGTDYRSHLQENPKAVLPEGPFFFAKLPSTVIGPGQPIKYPQYSQQVDYEVELAVVIGRVMKDTAEHEVFDHVFGYTLLNDVSARDVQFRNGQITLGKNFDTFCPLGPCIITKDELPHPDRVNLKMFLNGQTMQDGSTRDWLFNLPTLLSFLSHRITLEPGDIVSTGTPAGVGAFRKPQIFLQRGDVIRLEAAEIGVLENEVR
jgi:2,4-didehydro-3-deoxy-L-rhamnonate hydrolase